MPSTSHSLSASRRTLLAAGLLMGASLLPGCSMLGLSKSPATLNATVVASAQVNPDTRKRPSPVMVRVFELKSSTSFDQADFVSLFEKEQAVLGADLLGRDEFVLRPGESRSVSKQLSPDTRFIGVMVGYREIERARWRAVVPVAVGKKNEMRIDLAEIAVQALRTS
ncbi:MAG TPA: type VI secretion system lipoprotein TssJ, partial [Rhizobacter sp.]|nr:type VI secretion system lipoprotein TssJ [Rhizobacter sp.]